jgi:hypothetical protein
MSAALVMIGFRGKERVSHGWKVDIFQRFGAITSQPILGGLHHRYCGI